MSAAHIALIVEDDAANADDLLNIVTSMGFQGVVAATRRDASEHLASQQFCLVLLDLQIKAEASSIKGHVSHGLALLEEARRRYGENRKVSTWAPILVVSGHAADPQAVADLMTTRADDVIQKPIEAAMVVERIRRALRMAGRENHASCSLMPPQPLDESTLYLTIAGDREGRRVGVAISGRIVFLAEGELVTLLQLGIAALEGRRASAKQLGCKPDQGCQVVSRLRSRLQPVLPRGASIITNARGVGYCLSDQVEIGECNLSSLRSLENARIRELAAEWERLRVASRKRVTT